MPQTRDEGVASPIVLKCILAVAAISVLLAGCKHETPAGSIVLTQIPVAAAAEATATVMDARYPAGSRVVVLEPPFRADQVRDVSRGLTAAGDACVSWDGRWIYFAGKRSANADWQIYRVAGAGGNPEQLTNMPGGAMDPAIAAHDELVFSSPVPKAAGMARSSIAANGDAGHARVAEKPAAVPHPQTAAIYGQWPGKPPVRFTFGPDDATSATVLRDGRILFVSAKPRDTRRAPAHLCLFAMNNDGTEVAAYAGQDDGGSLMRRPREFGDGRIAFMTSRDGAPAGRAEAVKSAAPFVTRAALLPFDVAGCRSVEWAADNELLLCVDTRGMFGRAMFANAAVYRIAADASELGAPIFHDPNWHSIEATPLRDRGEPQGHTTAVMPAMDAGTVLCLDVNDSSVSLGERSGQRAVQLRVFSRGGDGERHDLGTVPVAADGSVLVRLPVRTPLGFETVAADGAVLRHQPAFLWLHPGENRGCVGCHERRNHAPRNARPLAVMSPPARLDVAGGSDPDRVSAP